MTNPATSGVELPEMDLLRKFDVPAPRYTSYPTADRFNAAADWAAGGLGFIEGSGLTSGLPQQRGQDEYHDTAHWLFELQPERGLHAARPYA